MTGTLPEPTVTSPSGYSAMWLGRPDWMIKALPVTGTRFMKLVVDGETPTNGGGPETFDNAREFSLSMLSAIAHAESYMAENED